MTTTSPSPRTRGEILLMIGLLGGVLILVMSVLGIGLAWYFSDRPQHDQEEPRPILPTEEIKAPTGEVKAPTGEIKLPEETEHEKKVKHAIKEGAKYLRLRLEQDKLPTSSGTEPDHYPNHQTGVAALMSLALLESGMQPNDAIIRNVLTKVKEKSGQLTETYVLGCVLMFLNRLNDANALEKDDKQVAKRLALRLINGQIPSGQWSYINHPLKEEDEVRLMQTLKEGTYVPKGAISQYGSNSMTQFAMLALWGARKCDVPVRGPLMKAALQFHKTQKEDGSWRYRDGDGCYPDSNTCAGLLGLAYEQTLRDDEELKREPAIMPPPDPDFAEMRKKAFSRLGKAVGRKGVGGKLIGAESISDIYFLWCVERVAVIYNKKEIEKKDWYQWGSEILLRAQDKKTGSWKERFDPAVDTSFAVLFLTRANLAKDLTSRLRILQDHLAVPAINVPQPVKDRPKSR